MTVPVTIGVRQVRLGTEVRDYQLRRSNRRTLAITIEPGGGLVVTAPSQATEGQVETVLRRRREWIRRRTREVSSLPPPRSEREWVSGETHRYLGRQYRLKVVRGDESGVKLVGRFFRVTVSRAPSPEQVRRLMESWYLDRARRTFASRMEQLLRKNSRLGLNEPPPLIVRRLQTRWGSCSPRGSILLNVEAVRLPMSCIDYVIVHELCHLLHPNHGKAFRRVLSACMPDWERWRGRLATAEV
jgi:predicted metal-dependent hydrolase